MEESKGRMSEKRKGDEREEDDEGEILTENCETRTSYVHIRFI